MTNEDDTILSATSSNISVAPTKKGRKKKEAPRPIKVERFSDLDSKPSPISSRTRNGSLGRDNAAQDEENVQRNKSIYEDAVDDLPAGQTSTKVVNNETVTMAGNATMNLGGNATMNLGSNATMTLGNAPADSTYCTNPAQTTFQVTPGQATFIMDNPNATVTMGKKSATDEGDATFNVAAGGSNKKQSNEDKRSLSSTRNTMETAKDTSPTQNDSLITEDESFEKRQTIQKKTAAQPVPKLPSSAKVPYKMPTRTKELFK